MYIIIQRHVLGVHAWGSFKLNTQWTQCEAARLLSYIIRRADVGVCV